MRPVNQAQALLDFSPKAPQIEDFQGETYSPAADGVRLTGHLGRVYDLCLDGKWRTLAEIAQLTDGSEAGSSARLRDLRKPAFGAWNVERRRCPNQNSTYEYRINGKKP